MFSGKIVKEGYYYGIMIFFFLYCSLSMIFGEKLPNIPGSEFDAVFYRSIAQNFEGIYQTIGIDAFRIGRVLPFISVYFLSQATCFMGLMVSVDSLMVFQNILVLLISVLVFHYLMDSYNLQSAEKTISFLFVFFNAAFLKILPYYPYQTDIYAVCLTLLLLYCHKKGWNFLQYVLIVFGSFTWPLYPMVGFIFFIFPNTAVSNLEKRRLINSKIFSIVAIICYSLILGVILFEIKINSLGIFNNPLGPVRYKNYLLIIVSYLSTIVFIYFYFLNKSIWLSWFREQVELVNKRNLLFGLILFGIVSLVKDHFVNNQDSVHNAWMFMNRVVVFPLDAPFLFLVNHFQYFGFVIIFLFLGVIRNRGFELGVPYVWIYLLTGLLILDTESRQLINLFILTIPFVFVLVQKIEIDKKLITGVLVLQLILSRCWYQINTDEFLFAVREFSVNEIFNQPLQRYFHFFGRWQSLGVYSFFLIMGVVMFFTLGKMINWKNQ